GWNDPRVSLLDLQYHDIRPEKGLFYTLERANRIERLVQPEEIAKAERLPPTGTRAYFRGACLKKFSQEMYGGSWTSILFDLGNATIKRIPLMDPFRGTRDLTSELLDGIDTAQQLLNRLASHP
ncbi:MAG: proteasome accessory factor PafA2 family protein, partial [Nitrospirales bacterium]